MAHNKEPGTSGQTVASEGEVHCVKCGAVLTSGAVGLSGHCPDCLLQLALSPLSSLPKKDDFGEYRLVRQIGRGATGVVYEAIQLSVNRPVALKMLLDAN